MFLSFEGGSKSKSIIESSRCKKCWQNLLRRDRFKKKKILKPHVKGYPGVYYRDLNVQGCIGKDLCSGLYR